MPNIHATAIVDPGAELDASVTVGPYTIIGPHVKVGAGTTIGAHCVIEGHTTIGKDNRIFQFNSLGAIPQDKKYAGEPCELIVGDRNTIREFCTFNIGSPGVMTTGSWPTYIWRTTAEWETTQFLRTMPLWPAMCTSVIGSFWGAIPPCTSLCASVRTA
jgi:hypothetical protein